MAAKLIIDGATIADVFDQMFEFPGGEPWEPANTGFQIGGPPSGEPDCEEFMLGKPVEIVKTGETGFVFECKQSLYEPDLYNVEYDTVTGGVAREWFRANALTEATIH